MSRNFFILFRENFWVISDINYKSYEQLLALPKKMDSKVAKTEKIKIFQKI